MAEQKVYTKPDTQPTGVIPANFSEGIIGEIIGKDGCYFKLTTENTKVDFIWYDDSEQKIFIWGKPEETQKALDILNHRCKAIIDRRSQQTETVEQ